MPFTGRFGVGYRPCKNNTFNVAVIIRLQSIGGYVWEEVKVVR